MLLILLLLLQAGERRTLNDEILDLRRAKDFTPKLRNTKNAGVLLVIPLVHSTFKLKNKYRNHSLKDHRNPFKPKITMHGLALWSLEQVTTGNQPGYPEAQRRSPELFENLEQYAKLASGIFAMSPKM